MGQAGLAVVAVRLQCWVFAELPGDVKIIDLAGKKDANGNDIGPDGVIKADDRAIIGDPNRSSQPVGRTRSAWGAFA